ncbi:MFS transporter [Azospirillum palustre]
MVLASLGGVFEVYDFIIYGVFAREIGAQFFPSSNPVAVLLSTFAVFAIGYLARPLGGIFIGSLGDRYGRKLIFLLSIWGMSAVTIVIGFLPGYATIGIFAPILLVLLRAIQGVFLAGELPCSIVYVTEEMPKRAGLVSGAVIACANMGFLVAALVSLGIRLSLPAEEVGNYGWRVAFVVGGLLGLISYKFRRSLEESEEFKLMKNSVSKAPFREVMSNYWRQILIGVGMACIVNVSNISLSVVLPSYLATVLGYAPASVSVAQNVGLGSSIVIIFIIAWLTDRVPARLLHGASSVIILVAVYPIYYLLVDGQIGLVLAYGLLGCLAGLVNGTYAFLLADLFPTRVRFSGVALSLNLSTVLFTATTPFAATELLRSTGIKEAPGLVVSAVAVIAIIVSLLSARYVGQIRAGIEGREPAPKPVG